MSGFESPNYTQTPNDFFSLIKEMSEAEMRVTAVMIRQTLGFHRGSFKMGLNKLADEAGLSRNGAKTGAEEAETRGTFRRLNPGSITEAEWELVIRGGQPVTTSLSDQSASDQGDGQSVTPIVGLKESIKDKEQREVVAQKLSDSHFKFNPNSAQIISEWKERHTDERILQAIEVAISYRARSLNYVDQVLDRWEMDGYPPTREEKKALRASKNGKTEDLQAGLAAFVARHEQVGAD